MSQFKKMIEAEVSEGTPIRFVSLPDNLPDASPTAKHRYQAARQRMYQAQLQAAVVAAEWCWPYEYAKAKHTFEQTLLDLFSQTCDKVRW